MEGFKRILFRIIPFVLLLCFIAYGIEVLNSQGVQHLNNITYLHEIIVRDSNNQELYRYYEYDFATYIKNLSVEHFIYVFNHAFDISSMIDLKNTLNAIIRDGYSALDVAKITCNTIIGLLNSIIMIINCILLTPIKIIICIIMTGMSVAGINIDRTTNTNPVNQFMWEFIYYIQFPSIPYWQ